MDPLVDEFVPVGVVGVTSVVEPVEVVASDVAVPSVADVSAVGPGHPASARAASARPHESCCFIIIADYTAA
ncbi:hypothetical protein [Nannocystis pusilla]|uniref:hypothetical protein n=1 Tax=Nannocystis pusilla TaxID=889268 RepID=UPI003B7DEFFC